MSKKICLNLALVTLCCGMVLPNFHNDAVKVEAMMSNDINMQVCQTCEYAPNPQKAHVVSLLNSTTQALENRTVFETSAHLYDTKKENTIKIVGDTKEGSPYVTNVKIQVYEKRKLVAEIVPSTNYGYDPTVIAADFKGNGQNQLFYGANSGGSGGYGFYYVFDVQKDSVTTMFDYEKYSNSGKYEGKFLDDYRAEIKNLTSGTVYTLDVSGMDKSFLNKIYTKDGTALDVPININPVSTVFPYYNSTYSRFDLLTYRSVVAIAEVNGLGYIESNLSYEDSEFNPYIESFAVFGVSQE